MRKQTSMDKDDSPNQNPEKSIISAPVTLKCLMLSHYKHTAKPALSNHLRDQQKSLVIGDVFSNKGGVGLY